jgi:hypothetical protein
MRKRLILHALMIIMCASLPLNKVVAQKKTVSYVFLFQINEGSLKSLSDRDYELVASIHSISDPFLLTIPPHTLGKKVPFRPNQDKFFKVVDSFEKKPPNAILRFEQQTLPVVITKRTLSDNWIHFELSYLGQDRLSKKIDYKGKLTLFVDDTGTGNEGMTQQFGCSSAEGENDITCYFTSLTGHANATACNGYQNPTTVESYNTCVLCTIETRSECCAEYPVRDCD